MSDGEIDHGEFKLLTQALLRVVRLYLVSVQKARGPSQQNTFTVMNAIAAIAGQQMAAVPLEHRVTVRNWFDDAVTLSARDMEEMNVRTEDRTEGSVGGSAEGAAWE